MIIMKILAVLFALLIVTKIVMLLVGQLSSMILTMAGLGMKSPSS